jgi:hypothetical protein
MPPPLYPRCDGPPEGFCNRLCRRSAMCSSTSGAGRESQSGRACVFLPAQFPQNPYESRNSRTSPALPARASALFSMKTLQTDGLFFHGMEEVDGSNPSRSTTTFQTLTVPRPASNVVAGVQLESKPNLGMDSLGTVWILMLPTSRPSPPP